MALGRFDNIISDQQSYDHNNFFQAGEKSLDLQPKLLVKFKFRRFAKHSEIQMIKNDLSKLKSDFNQKFKEFNQLIHKNMRRKVNIDAYNYYYANKESLDEISKAYQNKTAENKIGIETWGKKVSLIILNDQAIENCYANLMSLQLHVSKVENQLEQKRKEINDQIINLLKDILNVAFWQSRGKGIFGDKCPDSITDYANVTKRTDLNSIQMLQKIMHVLEDKNKSADFKLLDPAYAKSTDKHPDLLALHRAIYVALEGDLSQLVSLREKIQKELKIDASPKLKQGIYKL